MSRIDDGIELAAEQIVGAGLRRAFRGIANRKVLRAPPGSQQSTIFEQSEKTIRSRSINILQAGLAKNFDRLIGPSQASGVSRVVCLLSL